MGDREMIIDYVAKPQAEPTPSNAEIRSRFMKIIRYYTAYGMTTDELYYEFLQTLEQFEDEQANA